MRLATDLAILVLGAGLPAGLMLYLLRQALFGPRGRAWNAIMFGAVTLSGAAVVAIWLAFARAEQGVNACLALSPARPLDCEDNWLLTVIVGLPAVLSVAAFLLAGVAVRVWRGRRGDG